MAQQFTTNSGVVLKIPGTYVEQQVIANQGGTAASGVMTLIGEANEGPDYTKESNLDANGFGPDQIADVQAKYGSGRLVDAFREASAAANDPNIVGSVSLIKIVKVNPSTAASAAISRNGFGEYSILTALREGAPGNLIMYNSDVSVAEIPPQTGLFSYTPIYTGTASFHLRENGSAAEAVSIASLTDGPDFAAAIESLSNGTLASGGIQELPLTGKVGNIALAVLDATPGAGIIQISLPGLMDPLPSVGDSLVIPATGDFGAAGDSAIIGAANANRASYVITAVNNNSGTSTITAQEINTPAGATVVAVSSTPILADTDFICYTQVNVQNITGMDRQATVGLSAVTFTTTSNSNGLFTMTVSTGFAAIPVAGDYVTVPSTFAGVAAGFYQVTAASLGAFTCQRLSNGSSGTTGSHVTAGPITQGTQPFVVSKPAIDGLGKSLELNGDLSDIARNPQSTDAASFSTGNPLLVSAAEYENSFSVSRGTNTNSFISGGDIVASIGSSNESATIVINSSSVSVYLSAVLQFSMAYNQFPTLQNVVDYINSQPGYYASVSSAQFSLMASAALDRGTFKLSASSSDNAPARLKHDATQFAANSSGAGYAIMTLASGTQSGLPEVIEPAQFLHGGTKAPSTSAQWADAIEACEGITTNFLTPCISVDASQDILSGDTESGSTYAIDAVNAACKSNVILMSALKARQNRIAIVSKSATYNQQKNAASQLASFRVGMTFQNVLALSAQGAIVTYQPWMGAVVAAGMQAAAGYKGIVKKFANINGISQPFNDFSPNKPSDLEDALTAGLLILESVKTGGFRWVSDQLTYSLDNNFVYNSLQAVYIADLMALTLIQNFDNAIVGKSVAEISATAALSFLEAQMFDFLRLRWTAPSDDAPRGFKNASVKINGGVMNIYLEAKLAGLIYFVPIQFQISQVQQSASQ